MNIKEQMKLQKWAADMAEQKASGLTNGQWCQLKGMPLSTYEYHCKRVRDAMQEALECDKSTDIVPAKQDLPKPVFAKVELKQQEKDNNIGSGINIKNHDIMINIAPDSNIEHVRLVMEMLANA